MAQFTTLLRDLQHSCRCDIAGRLAVWTERQTTLNSELGVLLKTASRIHTARPACGYTTAQNKALKSAQLRIGQIRQRELYIADQMVSWLEAQ
ncbi:MAG: hypothetical protein ACYTEQ_19195 [Planctomycetota bacterium]|jgi:hypothetical protein